MKRLILTALIILISTNLFAANVMEESYSFTTIPDMIPPYVTDRYPANGAVGIPVDTVISCKICDEESGVDINSIIMKVNNVEIVPQITGTQEAYELQYGPGLLPWNHIISVDLSCTDLSDN